MEEYLKKIAEELFKMNNKFERLIKILEEKPKQKEEIVPSTSQPMIGSTGEYNETKEEGYEK